MTPRNSQRNLLRRPNELKEQLMSVNYDRALEEEKIMNKVFPSIELQQNTCNVNNSEDKQQILNTEIFEIGSVSRCFGCASNETLDTVETADKFRLNTVRSFALFGSVTFIKTLGEFFLRAYYVFEDAEEASFVYPALDIFEVLLTLYALYCSFMFCSCLAQGLIYEY